MGKPLGGELFNELQHVAGRVENSVAIHVFGMLVAKAAEEFPEVGTLDETVVHDSGRCGEVIVDSEMRTVQPTVDRISQGCIGNADEIELGDAEASEVRFLKDDQAYSDARTQVDREYGEPAVEGLPQRQSYINAVLAGGMLEPPNRQEIDAFLDRYGRPDLSASHSPVLAGFDTNLLAWRIADQLGLAPGQNGLVNGFALATGVRDELDWDYKRSDTRLLEEAFGPEFERVWNQPAGANREGRLGENYYRQLRDHRYAEEPVSDRGDEEIVQAYEAFQREGNKEVIRFSNDRDFVERARSHRVLAQRVEFPDGLPESLTASWTEIQDMLHVLTILFGVLSLPKVTLYGVWKGKGGQDWHDELPEVDCRSPTVESLLERDRRIIEDHELTG